MPAYLLLQTKIYATTKLYLILTVHKLTICDYVEDLRYLL